MRSSSPVGKTAGSICRWSVNNMNASPLFTQWMDDFFRSYYVHRPVNATFIGVHDHDHRLPDYSEKGTGDVLAEMQHLLDRLPGLPVESLTPVEKIDRTLAEGFLKIQMWEFQSDHFQRGNPSVYTGEAVFGLLSLFLTDFAPISERVESAVQRMEAVPALLAQGRANVRKAPRPWTERAIRECEGALNFLHDGVDLLVTGKKIGNPVFKKAAEKAAAAFVEFQAYLQTELLAAPADHYASGEDALDLVMRQGHFIDDDPDEIVAYAEEQMNEAAGNLKEHAADFGVKDSSDALSRLADLHPTLEHYYNRYTELWEQTRAVAEEQDLLTWPEFPIRYIPRPGWSRKAAPYLYFLYYRSPAAFNRPEVHDYLVTPIDDDMPVEEQQRLLRATNDSVIKLNHVVHHGG
ncbi:MAG: DUF885 family protein, partial [Anaerolineales bacterium]